MQCFRSGCSVWRQWESTDHCTDQLYGISWGMWFSGSQPSLILRSAFGNYYSMCCLEGPSRPRIPQFCETYQYIGEKYLGKKSSFISHLLRMYWVPSIGNVTVDKKAESCCCGLSLSTPTWPPGKTNGNLAAPPPPHHYPIGQAFFFFNFGFQRIKIIS